MTTQSSSLDDAARRNFLEIIKTQLHETGIRWESMEYRTMHPFGGYGLVVTAPNIPGEARIIAISLYSKIMVDYAHFPGKGVPHYQLRIIGSNGRDQIAFLISRNPEEILNTIKTWAGSPSLEEVFGSPLPRLHERELAYLRPLARKRAEIQQCMQAILTRGIERCSEAVWQEFGLVYDNTFRQVYDGLTDGAREQLDDDLRHLAADQLLSNFPRDPDGHLLTGTVVPLEKYAYRFPQKQTRQMWLAAISPQRRRDPQAITLTLVSLIGVNHAYRWNQARWLWDICGQAVSEEIRWGVEGLALEQLGLENRADNLAYFTERCTQSAATLADRVSLCMLLQDEGRIEEAFALFDAELSPNVLRILYGQHFFLNSHLNTAYYGESWATTLLDALRRAAPWHFARALEAENNLRLLVLPHQRQQSKASLVLTKANKHSTIPQLIIECTASNKRLPETAWKRPVELDLQRFKFSNRIE